jgi:glycosyltransferase involved in cell wall biosynthesis
MDIVFVTAGSVRSHEDFIGGDLSGTESQIRGVATELASRGHSVQIVRRGDSDQVCEAPMGFEVVDRWAPAVGSGLVGQIPTKLLFSYRARRHVQSKDPDIVVVCMKYVTAFTATLSWPVVHFAFNNPADITPGKGPVAARATRYVERHIATNVNGIVVRNAAVAEWLQNRATGTVRQINCGIDLSAYEPSEAEEYVLYGGRLAPEKNVGLLVRGYARLDRSTRERFPLRVVGEGPLEDDLRSLAQRLDVDDTVEFESWLPTEAFRRRLADASCLVLSSVYEGMPVAAIEAMGCEVPVIGSDIPGIAAVVDHDETGLLFDPGDKADLARTLKRLLDNDAKRRQLGAAGRDAVKRAHRFASVADDYLGLFEEVVDG